jgi:putative NADH-flavin reductase
MNVTRQSIATRLVAAAGLLVFAAVPLDRVFADDGCEKASLELILIGATSRTADELISQALRRGHKVAALARRPDAVKHAAHTNLEVLQADVRDVESLSRAFKGRPDAVVVSLIGSRGDPREEVAVSDLFTVGIQNTLLAMKRNKLTTVFAVSSASVQELPKYGYKADTPRPENLTIRNGLWYYLKRGLYNDMADMESALRESDADYTVLRPGLILVEPPRGNIKAAVNVDAPGQRVITYDDFAAFILDAAESGEYSRSTVGVYSDRPIIFGGDINPEELMRRQGEINRKIREELGKQ